MTNSVSAPRVALTFEAGGDPVICGYMLDALCDTKTPATIFLHGAWAEEYPDLTRRMSAEGHELGNHSYTHLDLTQLGNEQIRDELAHADAVAVRLTGQRAYPWLRPPYGATDERVKCIATLEGYRIAQRNALDGGHWPGETTPESILKRTMENAYDGAALTYHLNNSKTLEVLPIAIKRLRDNGYELVRLSDLSFVSEYPDRHPDFADLQIDPGYLQVLQPGIPVWSLNVMEFGARAHFPANNLISLAKLGKVGFLLLTGDGDLEWQSALRRDRYFMILAGVVECYFRVAEDVDPRARAVARPGDFLLWPRGYEAKFSAAGQRWMLLIIG